MLLFLLLFLRFVTSEGLDIVSLLTCCVVCSCWPPLGRCTLVPLVMPQTLSRNVTCLSAAVRLREPSRLYLYVRAPCLPFIYLHCDCLLFVRAFSVCLFFLCLFVRIVEASRSLPAITCRDRDHLYRNALPSNTAPCKAPVHVQLSELLRRHGRHLLRDTLTLLSRIGVTVLLSLLVGMSVCALLVCVC